MDRLTRQAESLRRVVDAVADRQVTATDSDGWVRVIADGTPRLVAVEINPRLFRRSGADIGATLAEVIDEAIGTAREQGERARLAALPASLRMVSDGCSVPTDAGGGSVRPWADFGGGASQTLGGVLAGLPARLREIDGSVRELAEQPVEGVAAGRAVVVVLSGSGRVQGVELGRTVLDRPDSRALAGHVLRATNAALARISERVAGLAGVAEVPDVSASLDAFHARMDDLLLHLDAVARAVDAQIEAPPE